MSIFRTVCFCFISLLSECRTKLQIWILPLIVGQMGSLDSFVRWTVHCRSSRHFHSFWVSSVRLVHILSLRSLKLGLHCRMYAVFCPAIQQIHLSVSPILKVLNMWFLSLLKLFFSRASVCG